MTQISFPWSGTSTGDAGSYSDQYFADLFNALENNYNDGNNTATGYIPNTGETAAKPALTVEESTPNALSVVVNPGWALFYGRWYNNDADVTLTINSNLSGNDRIDTVIATIDWALQTIRVSVKEGTPDASPVAPTLTVNEGTLVEVAIADIDVANGAVSITNADITQRLEPLVRYYDMVKTVTAGTAPSSFLDEWNGLDYKSFPILFVRYDDDSAHFLSYDSGTNWLDISESHDFHYAVVGTYTTSSTSYVLVTGAEITFNADGVKQYQVVAMVSHDYSNNPLLRTTIFLDGSQFTNAIDMRVANSSNAMDVGTTHVYTLDGLSAGSHTVELRAKMTAGSSQIEDAYIEVREL